MNFGEDETGSDVRDGVTGDVAGSCSDVAFMAACCKRCCWRKAMTSALLRWTLDRSWSVPRGRLWRALSWEEIWGLGEERGSFSR